MRLTPKLDWRAVYKQFPTAIRDVEPALRQLRTPLERNNLFFASPDKLGMLDGSMVWHGRLIETCSSYGLDTGDAQILLEAEQLGIGALVRMDVDFRWAANDFEIYTWL